MATKVDEDKPGDIRVESRVTTLAAAEYVLEKAELSLAAAIPWFPNDINSVIFMEALRALSRHVTAYNRDIDPKYQASLDLPEHVQDPESLLDATDHAFRLLSTAVPAILSRIQEEFDRYEVDIILYFIASGELCEGTDEDGDLIFDEGVTPPTGPVRPQFDLTTEEWTKIRDASILLGGRTQDLTQPFRRQDSRAIPQRKSVPDETHDVGRVVAKTLDRAGPDGFANDSEPSAPGLPVAIQPREETCRPDISTELVINWVSLGPLGLEFNAKRRQVRRAGGEKTVDFVKSKTLYELIRVIGTYRDAYITMETIRSNWYNECPPEDSTIRDYISKLRKSLAVLNLKIINGRDMGYLLMDNTSPTAVD